MENEIISATPENVRRLFIYKQHLDRDSLRGSFREKFNSLMDDICFVQWDPVTVVAPSHLISIWSRIGKFKWAELDRQMWDEKSVFLHFTPTAMLVRMQDYPIFYSLMKNYPESLGNSWRSHIPPARKFIQDHKELRLQIMDKLRKGPADIKQFREFGKREKSQDGWSSGNEVTTMLYYLHMMGDVMVSGHVGNQNQWTITDEFLPEWVEKKDLPLNDMECIMAQKSLKALGIATATDINKYFVRGRYWNLNETLKRMVDESKILKVSIEGERKGRQMFINSEDVKTLEKIEKNGGTSGMKLISPFDNIISIRERLKRTFNFDYTLEQFFPKEKRKFGTYVLPILWNDQLVGRIDAKLEKKNGILQVNSVYAENGFEKVKEIGEKLDETVRDFAEFLNVEKVSYGNVRPDEWGRFLS